MILTGCWDLGQDVNPVCQNPFFDEQLSGNSISLANAPDCETAERPATPALPVRVPTSDRGFARIRHVMRFLPPIGQAAHLSSNGLPFQMRYANSVCDEYPVKQGTRIVLRHDWQNPKGQ